MSPPEERAPFVCPRCGATSHHPADAEHGYCARCRWWTGSPTLGTDEAIAHAEATGAIEPVEGDDRG